MDGGSGMAGSPLDLSRDSSSRPLARSSGTGHRRHRHSRRHNRLDTERRNTRDRSGRAGSSLSRRTEHLRGRDQARERSCFHGNGDAGGGSRGGGNLRAPPAKPTSLRPLDLKPDHDRRGEQQHRRQAKEPFPSHHRCLLSHPLEITEPSSRLGMNTVSHRCPLETSSYLILRRQAIPGHTKTDRVSGNEVPRQRLTGEGGTFHQRVQPLRNLHVDISTLHLDGIGRHRQLRNRTGIHRFGY